MPPAELAKKYFSPSREIAGRKALLRCLVSRKRAETAASIALLAGAGEARTPRRICSMNRRSRKRHFFRARFYHSTKFRLSAQFVLRESCWGCHPKPAFLRLAPLEKIHPRKEVHSHEKIQHAPPPPGNQDTLDRGRIRRVFRACFPLQKQFSDHMTAIQPENRPSDSRKSDPHKDGKPTFALDGKPTPNQLTINQLKENQLKGASGEPPAPFGRYKNIFLSESEYSELKEEYPDRLERFIEEMSEYIAASGNDYVCHAAALRRWLNREKKEKPKKGIPDYTYKEGESL